jgi:hypothetical protein
MTEMRGFVFAVTFILIFAALLNTIPAGLNGSGATLDSNVISPVNPSIIAGWTDSESYTAANLTALEYEYNLNDEDWIFSAKLPNAITLSSKVVWLIFVIGYDACTYTSGTVKRGTILTFDDIETDMEDGLVTYSMIRESGNAAGDLVIYYNTTDYESVADAWAAEELYFVHGVGISNTATNNVGALLISLLLFQLPDVPFLVNALIAVPIWAVVVYVLWYVIKEMIPFLG